jgi:hypothetical protein
MTHDHPSPSEHDEQKRLVQALSLALRDNPARGLLFAIPNGGLRNRIVARRLKEEGVKPGVPDLFLPVPAGGYHGLFIEMKRRPYRAKGKIHRFYPSKEQKKFIARLQEQGYRVEVCEGWERAVEAVEGYLRSELDVTGCDTTRQDMINQGDKNHER